MQDTTQIDAFYAQAQTAIASIAPLEKQLKEAKDSIATIHYQGQRAMEKITQDRSLPLNERLEVFFNAPDGFKLHLSRRPDGKCRAMQSAIDYAIDGRHSGDVVDISEMGGDSWHAYKKDPKAVIWWDEESGLLAEDFLEEMLQRTLTTFDC